MGLVVQSRVNPGKDGESHAEGRDSPRFVRGKHSSLGLAGAFAEVTNKRPSACPSALRTDGGERDPCGHERGHGGNERVAADEFAVRFHGGGMGVDGFLLSRSVMPLGNGGSASQNIERFDPGFDGP